MPEVVHEPVVIEVRPAPRSRSRIRLRGKDGGRARSRSGARNPFEYQDFGEREEKRMKGSDRSFDSMKIESPISRVRETVGTEKDTVEVVRKTAQERREVAERAEKVEQEQKKLKGKRSPKQTGDKTPASHAGTPKQWGSPKHGVQRPKESSQDKLREIHVDALIGKLTQVVEIGRESRTSAKSSPDVRHTKTASTPEISVQPPTPTDRQGKALLTAPPPTPTVGGLNDDRSPYGFSRTSPSVKDEEVRVRSRGLAHALRASPELIPNPNPEHAYYRNLRNDHDGHDRHDSRRSPYNSHAIPTLQRSPAPLDSQQPQQSQVSGARSTGSYVRLRGNVVRAARRFRVLGDRVEEAGAQTNAAGRRIEGLGITVERAGRGMHAAGRAGEELAAAEARSFGPDRAEDRRAVGGERIDGGGGGGVKKTVRWSKSIGREAKAREAAREMAEEHEAAARDARLAERRREEEVEEERWRRLEREMAGRMMKEARRRDEYDHKLGEQRELDEERRRRAELTRRELVRRRDDDDDHDDDIVSAGAVGRGGGDAAVLTDGAAGHGETDARLERRPGGERPGRGRDGDEERERRIRVDVMRKLRDAEGRIRRDREGVEEEQEARKLARTGR